MTWSIKRLLAIVVLAWVFSMVALPASANTDVVRDMTIDYDVQADGTVDVTWEIDWDFGETGRRGIIIDLLTQQPWELDETMDIVYTIDDIAVSSPTGAVTDFTTTRRKDGEFRFIEVRIGDEDRALDQPRHTYVLTYTIDGALRTFDGQPEFFWDVTSLDFVHADSATITVTAPSGVTEARCLIEDRECSASVSDGVATMHASPVPNGQTLSIVAGFPPASVAADEETLVDAGAPPWAVGPWAFLDNPWITGGLVTVLTAALSVFYAWRGRSPDERFDAVPPGVMNHHGPVTKKRLRGPIPVRFEPPEVSLADAGLAYHRGHDSSILAATLVQMAVHGSLEVTSEPLIVAQRDPSQIRQDYEQKVFDAAESTPTGAATGSTKLEAMWRSFNKALRGRDGSILSRVVRRRNPLNLISLFWVAAWGLAFYFWLGTDIGGEWVLLLLLPGLIIGSIIGALIVKANPRWRNRGLTARGTAIREQAEGFKTYIETAEAHQLNFEASQDIYRRYLPWAVLFGLTQRWTQVCENLARMGRIPPPDVSFIRGARSVGDVNRAVGRIDTVTRRARGEVMRSESRSSSSRSFRGGSGGRSGFSSGSRGGGGGGGSRSRSW